MPTQKIAYVKFSISDIITNYLLLKENKTTLYYAAKQKHENIFESILTHETMTIETIEETFNMLQNEGGAGLRSIKMAKMMMGETMGDKVQKETDYYSRT